MSSLSNDTWLYRAITKKAWVNWSNQQIQPAAFQLRWRTSSQQYESGISTNMNEELCYQKIDERGQYRLRLSPCFGIIKILVSDIVSLGLAVDNNHNSHVNIIGFPHPDREKEKYKDIVDRLTQKAQIHQIFDPPKKKPKKKK